MSFFVQWLVVVISCTVTLILLLFLINIVSTYRELKHKNAPSPLIILTKILSTCPVFIYDKLVGHRLKTSELNQFINKSIWIDWDIRWLAAGSSQGKVLEVISDSIGDGLLLQLRYPIIDTAEKVIFYPKKASTSLFRFRHASVSGKIIPTHKPEVYDHITSTLIVL